MVLILPNLPYKYRANSEVFRSRHHTRKRQTRVFLVEHCIDCPIANPDASCTLRRSSTGRAQEPGGTHDRANGSYNAFGQSSTRNIPPEIRPDHDIRPVEDAALAEEGTLSPSTEVANGRIPESEIIPEDGKGDKEKCRFPSSAFEMDSGQIPGAAAAKTT
jgi:hypothetical protein